MARHKLRTLQSWLQIAWTYNDAKNLCLMGKDKEKRKENGIMNIFDFIGE